MTARLPASVTARGPAPIGMRDTSVVVCLSARSGVSREEVGTQMGRAIYHRYGTIPSDDKALIKAIRECGVTGASHGLKFQVRLKDGFAWERSL